MRDNLSQRPKIEVPKTHWDYVADALAILGALGAAWLLLITWVPLPDDFPYTLLPGGEPVAVDDRWIVTLPLSMAIVNYVMLRLMTRIPYYFNYPWPITPENAVIQYRLSRSMVFWLNAIVVWMLLLIVWSQIRVSLGQTDSFPVVLVVGSLVLIHVVLGLFIYRAYQNRHGDRAGGRERPSSDHS